MGTSKIKGHIFYAKLRTIAPVGFRGPMDSLVLLAYVVLISRRLLDSVPPAVGPPIDVRLVITAVQ